MKNNSLIRVAKLILVSIILGIVYNIFASKSIPFIREKTVLQIASDSLLNELTNSDVHKNLLRVSLEQAFFLYTENTAKFIDARDQWDFAEGHVMGAINIPEFSFNPNDSLVNSLNKEDFYVIYCGSDDCEISERLAKELHKIGFSKLAILKDGWEVWLNNQYPTESEMPL